MMPNDSKDAVGSRKIPGVECLVGVGYREAFRGGLFLDRDAVDVLEFTTDHYIDAGPERLAELDLLREHFTLLPHSLDLSLGSAEGIDGAYLDKVAAVVEKAAPPWFSDHICFTRAGGVRIGHLAPLPYTREAVEVVRRNVAAVGAVVKTPLILENITYLMRWPNAEMDEAEFIRAIVGETGCGLLLDVTNLYANARNFGFDWRRFLDALPLDAVVQLHFVGLRENAVGVLIDAHADPVQSEVWQVFEEVAARCDPRAAILERDDDFPPFAELAAEVAAARRILREAKR